MPATPPDQEASTAPSDSKILGSAISELIRSGFPFQLAVEQRVRSLANLSAFPVASEVPWESGADRGFVDIVIDSNSAICCVVECKAVEKGEQHLTFLRSSREGRMEWSPVLFTERDGIGPQYHLTRLSDRIASDTAAFALEKIKGLQLEALAREATLAAEALATTGNFQFRRGRTYYLPVVVTNCPLMLCEFDPSEVDLRTRALDGKKVDSKRLPFIRFQKSLGTPQHPIEQPDFLWRLVRERPRNGNDVAATIAAFDRCTWIVDALELEGFLGMVLELGHGLPPRA